MNLIMSSTTEDIFSLQVNTDLNALSDVLNWFEAVTNPRLPPSLSWQCQLALSEGFTNAVSHAHQNLPPTTPIDLEVSFVFNHLEIKIWDWGEPFDLKGIMTQARIEESQSINNERGRGLIILRQAVDHIDYIRDEKGRNCLILGKEIF